MEDIIRTVERTVVDTQAETYQVLTLHEDDAVICMLKVYSDYLRKMNITNDNLGYANPNYMLTGGLNHTIRWVLEKRTKNSIRLDPRKWHEFSQEAMSFLSWGMEYNGISQQYVAYSKGILQADVDETKRIIEFKPKVEYNKAFILSQQLSFGLMYKHLVATGPTNLLDSLFFDWYAQVQFDPVQYNITVPWRFLVEGNIYIEVLDWFENNVLSELSPQTDLGGYTLKEFREFVCRLYANCFWVTSLENRFDQKFGNENAIDSLVIGLPRNDIIIWLSEITGTRKEIVERILLDLTFDHMRFDASLLNQPFIATSTGLIYLLPRLFASISFERMLSGAMNKGKKKEVYSSMINAIEKGILRQIETLLDDNYHVLIEPTFKNEQGKIITPDILFFDGTTLLVCDYKHFLNPFSPAEVITKMQEIEKGVKQVEKYRIFLEESRELLTQKFGEIVKDIPISGLLLFRWPMPIPIKNNPSIGMIDLISLKSVLKEVENLSIVELLQWIRTRPDLLRRSDDISEKIIESKVGGWSFTRSAFYTREDNVKIRF